SGQIVGSYNGGSFLFDQGSYTTLDVHVPGSIYTEVHGINATGQIVGSYWDGSTDHGFLFDGSYTTPDFVPRWINDAGQIVGETLLFDHGSYTILDVPDSLLPLLAG